MEITPNIITALAALGGSLIGGTMTIWGAKIAADKEYRLKKEEVIRGAATDRIKLLYEPLINSMSPTPPYDEFYLEREHCRSIIDKIEKNERYASSDLLRIFWKFRGEYYNDFDEINKKTGLELYEQAFYEYENLKEILGYGPILSKKSKLNVLFVKFSKYIDEIYYNLKSSRFIRRIKNLIRNKKIYITNK